MGKAYQTQKKIAQLKSETNALATRKMNAVSRKQTARMQSSTPTHMDLWNSGMKDSLQFQHRNPPELSIQDTPVHSECTLVHNHRKDQQMSTVLSEIKKWNTNT
jgi:hypothetical protein